MVLNYLHELIEKVCPINGIADLGNDIYRIDYKDEATEQQKQAAQQVIDSWPLEEKKLEKLAKIDAEWDQTIAQGWDSGQGILGISANDVALLSGAYALAKEADNLGLPLPKFIAMDNSTVEFSSITEMTMLLLRYGEARVNLASAFAARRKAVDEAASLEELESL